MIGYHGDIIRCGRRSSA